MEIKKEKKDEDTKGVIKDTYHGELARDGVILASELGLSLVGC